MAFIIYKETSLMTDYFEDFMFNVAVFSSLQKDAMKFETEKEARQFIKNNRVLRRCKVKEYIGLS